MEQFLEPLRRVGVEGGVNGMRATGATPQRLPGAAFVEGVDGVARGLRVASQGAGDPVGVFVPPAGEKYLASAEDEGIRRTQARLQGLALGIREGTREYWLFYATEDKP